MIMSQNNYRIYIKLIMIFFIKYDIINSEINSQNFMKLYYILIENYFFNNKVNNLQKKTLQLIKNVYD